MGCDPSTKRIRVAVACSCCSLHYYMPHGPKGNRDLFRLVGHSPSRSITVDYPPPWSAQCFSGGVLKKKRTLASPHGERLHQHNSKRVCIQKTVHCALDAGSSEEPLLLVDIKKIIYFKSFLSFQDDFLEDLELNSFFGAKALYKILKEINLSIIAFQLSESAFYLSSGLSLKNFQVKKNKVIRNLTLTLATLLHSPQPCPSFTSYLHQA